MFFYLCRFFTGAGIGRVRSHQLGHRRADPGPVRGTVDLIINGSFWLGTMFGAALSLVLLDTDRFAANRGWRIAFGLGAVLGLGILLVRRHVPESPRWMFIHGRNDEAEELVGGIERQIELLGRVFDSVGRRPMITLCYVLSGVLLVGTGLLFNAGVLSAGTLTACWVAASPARCCSASWSRPRRSTSSTAT